jgi:hypothetical protein
MVSKDLISRISRKAHDRIFGKGTSDIFQLKEFAKEWEEKGGTFIFVYGRDLGKTGHAEEDKMMGIIMVAPYAHLLVQAYGDLFCADGTHGIAHYGWRALPIACCNSLDNPHPAVLVLATSENADILCLSTRQLHAFLRDKGVNFELFANELDNGEAATAEGSSVTEDESALDEKFICPPVWRKFVEAVLNGTGHDVRMPMSKPTPTLLVDGGLAFDLYGRRIGFNKKECKLHLDSHNHVSVEPLK